MTGQCSKLSACLSSIQNSKLLIIVLIPVVLVDFCGRFKCVFRHKKGVSARRLYCVWGCWRWRFIAFSHSTWYN